MRLQEFQSKVDQVYVQESKDRSALAQQVTSLLEMKSAARRGGEGPDAGAEGLRENTG